MKHDLDKIELYLKWVWSLFDWYWVLLFSILFVAFTANPILVFLSIYVAVFLFKDKILDLIKWVGKWLEKKPK